MSTRYHYIANSAEEKSAHWHWQLAELVKVARRSMNRAREKVDEHQLEIELADSVEAVLADLDSLEQATMKAVQEEALRDLLGRQEALEK